MYTADPMFIYGPELYIDDGVCSCSSMYTGLMRLAVQAKMGRGATLANAFPYGDLFPWGIAPPIGGELVAYKHDGILRTPDYQ
jgi:hypothetical protein